MQNPAISTIEQQIREQLQREYGFASIKVEDIVQLTNTTAQIQVIIAKANGFSILLYCRVTLRDTHWSIDP